MNRKHAVILVILFLILLGVGYFTLSLLNKKNSEIEPDTRKIFAGTENSATYTDLNGNPISLEQFLGKMLVVTTWASWSPFSEADLVKMNDFSNELSSDKVVFIAINRKETRDQAQRYLNSIPDLPNLILVIDQEDFFYNSVGGYAMPESLVFDTKGTVIDHTRGIFDTTRTRELIEENLINLE